MDGVVLAWRRWLEKWGGAAEREQHTVSSPRLIVPTNLQIVNGHGIVVASLSSIAVAERNWRDPMMAAMGLSQA